MTAYRNLGTRGIDVPVSEPLDEDQVANNGGGFSFKLDDWSYLQRFLILGTEGGTYYVKEDKLTKDAAKCVERCIKEDGPRTVATIAQISSSGRANKNDPAILALAMCMALGDTATKRAAAGALPQVCRIGTHLFHFAQFVEQFRGWGRVLVDAVGNWYEAQEPEDLSYDLVKYRQRDGWGHDDLIKLSHPGRNKAHGSPNAHLYNWTLGERKGVAEISEPLYPAILGYEAAAKATDAKEIVELIQRYRLPRECIPTQFLKDKGVWSALLSVGMGMEAMVRNLGTMGSVGLLVPYSDDAKQIVERLGNAEAITRSRIHPLKLLGAYLVYKQGHGMRGDNSWQVVPQIVDALEEAYYKAFGNVTPTGKNTLLALDVSGSMSSPLGNLPYMSCAQGTAAMAMVIARTEPAYQVYGFSHQFTDLGITAKSTLEEAFKKVQDRNFGSTNPGLAIEHAEKHKWPVESFVIMTDNEVNSGSHPARLLVNYRRKTGINAKMSCVGMTATHMSLADPKDPGMMDFIGFDLNTPEAISEFVRI
jgi:60 kDa SS-A/Ro ribonucleoprotein